MSIVTIGEPAWLRLTPETALEPALPICDPHHHIWAHRHEPPAYQRYLLPDLAADIRDSGHNVRSTVFIEVKVFYRADGPQEMRPVGEVAHIDGCSAGVVYCLPLLAGRAKHTGELAARLRHPR